MVKFISLTFRVRRVVFAEHPQEALDADPPSLFRMRAAEMTLLPPSGSRESCVKYMRMMALFYVCF